MPLILIVELEFKNNILTENDCVENIYYVYKKFKKIL